MRLLDILHVSTTPGPLRPGEGVHFAPSDHTDCCSSTCYLVRALTLQVGSGCVRLLSASAVSALSFLISSLFSLFFLFSLFSLSFLVFSYFFPVFPVLPCHILFGLVRFPRSTPPAAPTSPVVTVDTHPLAVSRPGSQSFRPSMPVPGIVRREQTQAQIQLGIRLGMKSPVKTPDWVGF
jgi:hypothetical protein